MISIRAAIVSLRLESAESVLFFMPFKDVRAIVSYFWHFGDGATSTSANPQHTYIVPGNHVTTVKVTDNLGATTSNAVAVEVTVPNQNPVAVLQVVVQQQTLKSAFARFI